MKNDLLIIFLFFWILTLVAIGSNSAEKQTVEQYVEIFLKNQPKRLERSLGLIPYIKEVSKKNGVDHRLVVVMITKESAWQHKAQGGIGEIGLMQVHGVCARGQDLTTPKGQIKAGVECLRKARDMCNGTDKQMLTAYASGRCKSKSSHTQWLVKSRLRAAGELLK